MNNFFYSSSDYDLFKKALRTTKNEPVIINILSDDSSLNEGGEAGAVVNAQRKQMSSKFQASPFDKFFGPRKKRTDPLDMKDFSSWKNKNYRESEKQIDSAPETTAKFSFSDYLNSRTKDKRYNNEDELKADNQKSIEQMNSTDENFQKFSLDSYLNKLEQQTKAKKDFDETDDLVSDFVDENAMVMQNTEVDQDENFMNRSSVGVEDIAFGNEIKGDKFSFDKEELETVKARLDKLEREANNIKDKPTTKLISKNELSDITKDDDDDEFNFDKLGIEDDIERVNSKIDSLNKVLKSDVDTETETPKIEGNKFFEINKQFEEADSKKADYSRIATSESIAQRLSESAPVNVTGMGDGSTLVINTNGPSQVGGVEEFISPNPVAGTSFAEQVQTASSGGSVQPVSQGSVQPVSQSGSQSSVQPVSQSGSQDSVSQSSSQSTASSGTSVAASSEASTGSGQTVTAAGVVKPVIIVGAKTNPSELKDADETEESSTETSDTFVDAVEMIDEQADAVSADGVSVISGVDGIDGIDGFEAVDVDSLDFALGEESTSQINRSDEYITKADLRTITDEIIGKFSELNKNAQPSQTTGVNGAYETPYGMSYKPEDVYGSQASMVGQSPFASQGPSDNPLFDQNRNVFGIVATGGGNNNSEIDKEYKKKQDELQAQLMELIEQNKRTDEEITKKLELAEQEKLRVAEEYEKRLRELEESMLKREEAVKQQAYIDKLKNDIKFKKSENKYKLREEQIRESEKSNTQNLLDCEKLKSELRNCLSVSNLEMDKKLLECVNKIHKAEIEKQEQKVEELEQDLKEEKEEKEEREIEKPARQRTTTASKRRPSTVKSRMRTRTPRRRIDSDIIGGINFD